MEELVVNGHADESQHQNPKSKSNPREAIVNKHDLVHFLCKHNDQTLAAMVLTAKTKRRLEVVTGDMRTTIVQLHCDKEVWIVRGCNLRGGEVEWR
ncbi:hypothetical protein QL285_065210 [Trifolium repens]|jgi:hypothetical protein|nr:hypothetical protein QL285_065210 [Trifolium repens]